MCALKPLIANVIEQLPVESINEITPHLEALSGIVKGNEIYKFFHNVEEECHNYQNKIGSKEQSKPVENKEDKIGESQNKKESVSEEANQASKKETQPLEKAESSDTEGNASDADESPRPNKAPNSKASMKLKDLPEGLTKLRYPKNNAEVQLLRKGNKLTVTTKKPDESPKKLPEKDITGEAGEQLVRKYVDAITAA